MFYYKIFKLPANILVCMQTNNQLSFYYFLSNRPKIMKICGFAFDCN